MNNRWKKKSLNLQKEQCYGNFQIIVNQPSFQVYTFGTALFLLQLAGTLKSRSVVITGGVRDYTLRKT